MVFFHGGGDFTGSTHDPPYGSPPPLATHGVIVLTAEYRLGALGFFGHPLLVIALHHVVPCESNLRKTAVLFRASPDTQGSSAECSFLHQREEDWNQNQDVNG